MEHLFRQVVLSDEQLQAGLIGRVDPMLKRDWEPVPWSMIATFQFGRGEIEDHLEIVFQKTVDDLDEVFLAVLDLASGRRIALYQHTHAPYPGLELYILPQQFTTATDAPTVEDVTASVTDAVVLEVLDALEMPIGQVRWRRPRVARAWGRLPSGWPRILPTRRVVDYFTPTFSEEDVHAYFTTNPAVPTLQAITPPSIESISILSGRQMTGRWADARELYGKEVICVVTLRGHFVDAPPPALGPPSTCAQVHLVFDGLSGLLDWAFTELGAEQEGVSADGSCQS